MVDTKMLQTKSREAMYATLGAGQIVVEKARGAVDWTRSYVTPEGFKSFWLKQQKQAAKEYTKLAKRGEKLAKSIERSAPAKHALEQTKVARSQVKAAATSVRKALRADAEATKATAKKVS